MVTPTILLILLCQKISYLYFGNSLGGPSKMIISLFQSEDKTGRVYTTQWGTQSQVSELLMTYQKVAVNHDFLTKYRTCFLWAFNFKTRSDMFFLSLSHYGLIPSYKWKINHLWVMHEENFPFLILRVIILLWDRISPSAASWNINKII